MDKVFPLLVSDCLTAPERLVLFRTDKTLAEAVLQNSASIKLSVGGEGQACNSEQLATAMRLACDARPHVQLTMRHRLFTPPEALWQRLTILTLAEQQLSFETFTAFRQSRCAQHMHTLRLQRCTLQPMGQSGSRPEAGLSVRTLECIQCLPTSSYLATALSLTNKSKLQQLSTEGGEDATGYLHALPQLKQLRMVRVAVGDLRFQRILSHPTLTHVTLDELPLYQDHSAAQPPSLQDITLLRGCSIATLALLPLASIRRCTIQHELKFEGGEGVCGAMLDAALCRVAPYQDKVVCKSTPRKDYWDPLAPVFQLDFSSRCTMQHMQQAITVCTRHLEGVLMLVRPPDTVLAALAAALPRTITTLCFHGATQPLQPYLPSHVEHVVLASCRRTMSQIHQIVTGVTRPITFTFHGLVVPDFVRPTADERLAWFQAQIHTWLASSPNRVQVAVVGGIKGY